MGTVGAAAGLGLRPPRLGKRPRVRTQRYTGSKMALPGLKPPPPAYFLQPWCNMMRSGPSHLRGPAQTKQSGNETTGQARPPGPVAPAYIRTSSAPALPPGTHISILLLCFSAWFPLRQR